MQGKDLACRLRRTGIGQGTKQVMVRGSTEKSTNKTDHIGDLLHWLNVIARDEFVIGIEKLYISLLERTLGQEQTFDT